MFSICLGQIVRRRLYRVRMMLYESHGWENDREPKTFSSRGGDPPRKETPTGVLDPPVPPKRPPGPLPALTPGLWMRLLAIVLLSGIGLAILGTLLRLFR